VLFLSLAAPGAALGQSANPSEREAQRPPVEDSQSVSTNGVTKGTAHAPVMGAEKRPITADGLVKVGPRVFEDIAGWSGLPVGSMSWEA
jgi:hypothetical protein